MSYYSDASLVMIPSGVKNGTVFSQKPLSSDGELTFSRASNATRVNSSGLVEKVRTNLLLSSGDISTQSTYWASNQSGSSVQNAAVAPDGTTTASQITSIGTSFSGVSQGSISVSAVPYTYSCYLKAVSGTPTVRLTFYDGVTFHQGNFTITSEWVRYSFDFTPLAGSFSVYNTCSSADTWLAWGAMLEQGDVVTDYIATTSSAVSVGPVSGLPRLDYSGGASCPSLLLEPQRTNVITYSEQLDNASWTKQNTTIIANATTSPDGYVNADKMQDSASGSSVKLIAKTAATNGVHTISGYFKKAEYNFVVVHAFGFAGAVFNLNTGVKVSEGGGTGTITSAGNGWYRCSFTFTGIGNTNIYFSQSVDGNFLFSGTAGSGIFAWGLQVEAGSYASSYINTLSTAVTRVNDAASKTGISSLIGQTEGVLFVDFVYKPVFDTTQTTYRVCLSDGTYNKRVLIYPNNSNQLDVLVNGVVFSGSSYALTVGQRYKVALAYGATSVCYINGSQAFGYTSGTPVGGYTQFQFSDAVGASTRTFNGPINQALIFKTRLSNADLATLTTI